MSPMTKTSALMGLLASVAQVAAHGFVNGIDVDGTYYTGYLVNEYPYQTNPPSSIGWADTATDLGFVAPDAYASGDIICHLGATNAALTAPVTAGKTVTMFWNTWPESHHGPVIDYIANCNGDCSTVDKTTLEFVKIGESGLISDTTSPGTWASDNLIANNLSWAITIPSTLAAGNYVLRHEIIALHSAGSSDGAQNYPQCVNLQVTGSGTDAPAGTLGEALYTETDPGILINIYTTGIDYTIPGPTLWSGASSGSATVVASVASSTAAAIVTTSAVSVEAQATSVTPTTLATVVKSSTTSSAAPIETGASEDDDSCEA